MKKIHLLSPAVSNAGNYLDAGHDVAVGDGKDHISAARAKDFVDSARATAATDSATPSSK